MADKEEMIWLEFDIPKPKVAIEATRCTTMTRQEAINRMADAMSDAAKRSCDKEFVAEAALNALLEGK